VVWLVADGDGSLRSPSLSRL